MRHNGYYPPWTPEEDNIIREQTRTNKYSYRDISRIFMPSRTFNAIAMRSRKLGIGNKDYLYHLYSHDDNFFHVPNLTNSFYAGFISADGYIQKKGSLSIGISISDYDLLRQFKDDVRYTGPIGIYTRKKGGFEGYDKPSTICLLDIHNCPNILFDLRQNYGVIPDKTYRIRPPNLMHLSHKLAFAKGYIDGDGSIHLVDSSVHSVFIKISSCTYDILAWVKELVDGLEFTTHRAFTYKPNKVTGKNHYELRFAGIRASKLFLLLSSLDTPFLARKWNQPKIHDYIAAQRAKYPSLFSDVDQLIARLKAEQTPLLAPLISLPS